MGAPVLTMPWTYDASGPLGGGSQRRAGAWRHGANPLLDCLLADDNARRRAANAGGSLRGLNSLSRPVLTNSRISREVVDRPALC
jgi:hypothetical protein